MVGYISVVKFETKPESTEEYVRIEQEASTQNIPGLRRRVVIQTGENSFIGLIEYEEISSVVEAQDDLVAHLDRFRHCLVELDDNGNVTEAVSGTIIYDENNPSG